MKSRVSRTLEPIRDFRTGDLLYAVDRPLPLIEPGSVTDAEVAMVYRDHLALYGFHGQFAGRTDSAVRILAASGETRWYRISQILGHCRPVTD